MVISEKLWDITGGGKNTLNIVQIKERDPELTRDLLDIWESAVRATHLFLPEAEIGRIKQFVPRALESVPLLLAAETEDGTPVGFMGVAERKLEMLFVSNEYRGQGIGKQLLEFGMARACVDELTVNEQNALAKGFYEHMGFAVCRRTERDEQGGPYPLLYMKKIENKGGKL